MESSDDEPTPIGADVAAAKGTKKATKKRRRSPEEEAELAAILERRGKRLKQVRERAGFTAVLQVSNRTGALDSGSLGRAEKGEKDLTLTVAERLATAYGVSLDVLVGRAPLPGRIDRYPSRQPIIDSEEYENAHADVRKRFSETAPIGAERWSTVAWARRFDALVSAHAAFGRLPDEPDDSRSIRSTR